MIALTGGQLIAVTVLAVAVVVLVCAVLCEHAYQRGWDDSAALDSDIRSFGQRDGRVS